MNLEYKVDLFQILMIAVYFLDGLQSERRKYEYLAVDFDVETRTGWIFHVSPLIVRECCGSIILSCFKVLMFILLQ